MRKPAPGTPSFRKPRGNLRRTNKTSAPATSRGDLRPVQPSKPGPIDQATYFLFAGLQFILTCGVVYMLLNQLLRTPIHAAHHLPPMPGGTSL
ncbi:hypothetical protein K402DRAFT_389833 [Aulographum hederae CBS 113979]|uniref:Uncharacterized protein n=1 Tax=Aulographum hederae CBS 113979 TaxID=1176131 RepID=A0A6G1HAL9_9PEZI|nr:hypothetical protein K402DRAFT_389833 [Aulographum hederae CBS 113979]